MLLSALLSKADIISVENFEEREISLITENSKKAHSGAIFVSIQGVRYDGGDFIPEAKGRGCRVFVCDAKSPISTKETIILSKNPRKTLAELSKALWFSDFRNMHIIGITGTKGKTTTGKMLLECIAKRGIGVVLIGTLGVEYRGVERPSVYTENTTPSAPFIYETVNEAYKMGARAVIIEVSSQALDCYRVFGIPFTVCIFTNFSPDHVGLYEHPSYEEYFDAKLKLFKDYGASLFVINADDKCASKFFDIGLKTGAKCVKVSSREPGDFFFEVKSSGLLKTEFSLNGCEFKIPMGGEYNAANASLALAAVSTLFNETLSFFKTPLEEVKVSGRYEVYELCGVNIIIDFAHNEESFKSICTNVRSIARGRIILVFGSVGGRSRSRRRSIAAAAEKYADFSVITSDNPGYEDADKICEEIYSYFSDKTKAVTVTDREDAIKCALSLSNKDDFVLLLGKGHEKFQEIGAQKIPFCEKEILLSMGALPI